MRQAVDVENDMRRAQLELNGTAASFQKETQRVQGNMEVETGDVATRLLNELKRVDGDLGKFTTRSLDVRCAGLGTSL